MPSRRDVLSALAGVAVLPTIAPGSVRAGRHAVPPRFQRLDWAGLRMVAGETSVYFDAVRAGAAWGDAWAGPSHDTPLDTPRFRAVISHLHADHYDRVLLRSLAERARGSLICPGAMAATAAADGLRLRAVDAWVPEIADGILFIPVPAVDGMGDEQVSWVVEAGGVRVIHCGDTMWHGRFPVIGRALGPFAAAFLPINGAIAGSAPDSLRGQAVLSPEQAVLAGLQLGARLLVPIHYGVRASTDYTEIDDPEGRFLRAARERGAAVRVLRPLEWWEPDRAG